MMLSFRNSSSLVSLSRQPIKAATAAAHLHNKTPPSSSAGPLCKSFAIFPGIRSFSSSSPLITNPKQIIKAPKLLTYDGSHGTMREFTAKVGDMIQKDQEIGMIETIKMFYEIESPATGIISKLLVSPGDEIRSGQEVAMLELQDTKVEE